MMGTRISGFIAYEFEVIANSQRDVPGNRNSESFILDSRSSSVPREEYLDRDIPAARQTLVQRGIILYRMRYYKSYSSSHAGCCRLNSSSAASMATATFRALSRAECAEKFGQFTLSGL